MFVVSDEPADDEPADDQAGGDADSESSDAEDRPTPVVEETFGVRRVRIELGYDTPTHVEVVDGLEMGRRVIVAGQAGLSEDARVVVSEREQDEPEGSGSTRAGTTP